MPSTPRAALFTVSLVLALGGCSTSDTAAETLDAGDSGGGSFDSARPLDAVADGAPDARLDSPGDLGADAVDGKLDAPDAADAPDADAACDPTARLSFPIADPPPCFDGLPTAAPITLSGAAGKTIANVAITNPSGPCIVIHGGSDIVIEHVALGPCKGDGIVIDGGATRVTVRDSYVHDTVGNGVATDGVDAVTVTGTTFARNSSGGYFLVSTHVRFERNAALDVQGPGPRGQLVQFDKVTGDGNVVRCNVMENHAGKSVPEDGINMFSSTGTAASPILVEGNRIKGGGPSMSGGGILLGDGGGAYEISRANVLADPGQYGTAVAGGSHMVIDGNRVFARKQPFTNTGIYVWDQYASSCTDVTVKGNVVDWTNRDGAKNPWWNGGNCAATTETGNDWSASLDATIVDAVPDVCK